METIPSSFWPYPSVRDCLKLTVFAFNLSEKYRMPVVILSDEVVAHTREKIVIPVAGSEVEVIDRMKAAASRSGTSPMRKRGRGPSHGRLRRRLPASRNGTDASRCARISDRTPDEIDALMRSVFSERSRRISRYSANGEQHDRGCGDAVIAYGSVSRSARRAVARPGSTG